MEPLGCRLQRLRLAKGMNLVQAEKATGQSRTSLRRYESGVRQPSGAHLQALSVAYGDPGLLAYNRPPRSCGPRVYGRTASDLSSVFDFKPLFVPLPSVEVAYRAATGYATGRLLLQRIVAQRGQSPNRWRGIKMLAYELNGIEQLVVLHLLDLQADICAIGPHQLGFMATLAVPAQRPFLALVLEVEGTMIVFFPQMGVETRRGAFPYLDFLVGVSRDGKRCFLDIEIDGPGRDKEHDRLRETRLQLPTLRFSTTRVERADFGNALVQACMQMAHQTLKTGTSVA